MGFSLKDRFLGRAGALALAGALLLPGVAMAEDSPAAPVPEGDSAIAVDASFAACAFIGQIRAPRTPEQKRLAAWYENLSRSPTAKATLDKALADGMRICFDPALVEPNECGFLMSGAYSHGEDAIRLNPDENIASVLMEATLAHEGRHKEQEMAAPTGFEPENIPPWERISYSWLIEVDARINEVVVAHEMELQHDNRMMESLEQQESYKPMIEAFRGVLGTNAEDVKGAMRAAAVSTMKKTSLFFKYVEMTMAWEARAGIKFNPYAGASTYMAESVLRSVTEIGAYGNYMDETLLAAVRGLFTEDDYRSLVKSREAAVHAEDGVSGDVCVLKEDRAAAAEPAPVLSN